MKLYDYQDAAVDAIYDYFKHNTGNPCVAMPTGTGKSLVIGDFCRKAVKYHPSTRIIVATHVKELVSQNYATMLKLWPHAPAGVFSAGLRRRDTALPIIFGGIGSIVNAVLDFGWRDLFLVDEAHLISPNEGTVYQNVISALKLINPAMKVIGFSATPFRLGQGYITDGGVLTDICYDLTGVAAFNRLINEGYLSPLIPKRTRVALDISDVGMNNGDFKSGELQRAVDKTEITRAALIESCEIGENRRSWMTFASGIEHAEHVAEMQRSFGINAACVHSKMTTKERDERINDFKRGKLRSIVGYKVLTTGFDHRPIDFIIDLYPTASPGMHVQKYGRGTRVSPETGKENCIVADYARNTERLGPINDPQIPRKKGPGTGEVPVRICDVCGTYNHASARVCIGCGMEFTFRPKIVQHASTQEIIRADVVEQQIEYYNVVRTIYSRHKKIGSPDSIKVSYFCGAMGLLRFNEWVTLEHPGFPGRKAREWWRQRFVAETGRDQIIPETVDEALNLTVYLKQPARLRVHVNKKNPEILGHEF